MMPALLKQLTSALVEFSSTTRLYALTVEDSGTGPSVGELLVEAFFANDAVQELGARDVIVLSTSAHVALETLLGQQVSLSVSLADGTRTSFDGEISEVAMLDSDGGFARYRIRISPWLWRLGQVRNSRVWQDKTVIEIVDAVFQPYLPLPRWRWSALSWEAKSRIQESAPVDIQGFIVALPVSWTAGEDNSSQMNLTLLANNHDIENDSRHLASVGQDGHANLEKWSRNEAAKPIV